MKPIQAELSVTRNKTTEGFGWRLYVPGRTLTTSLDAYATRKGAILAGRAFGKRCGWMVVLS